MSSPFLDRYQQLLDFSGAAYEGRFVTSPGVREVSATQLSAPLPFCSSTGSTFVDGGEFRARLCYLSFRGPEEGAEGAERYVEGMVKRHGHFSVWNAHVVEFLICGVTTETILELCAHREASCSRLTTSKTRARTDAFYRIFGTEEERERQKRHIEAWCAGGREAVKADGGLTVEQRNMIDLGVKCGAMTFAMSLKDYRRFLAGRLAEEGNETEVKEVARLILSHLHRSFPFIFDDLHAAGISSE